MIQLFNSIGGIWAEYFGFAVLQNTVFLAFLFLLLYYSRRWPARIKCLIGCVGIIKLLLPPFMPSGLFFSASEPLGAIQGGTFALRFSEAVSGPGTAAAPVGPRLHTAAVVFIVWAMFVICYILYSWFATLRLLHLLRSAEQVEGCKASALAARREIGVYRSSRISIPLTVGILPRKIYVPANWGQWSEECRLVAIKHELAHIERRDGIFQILQIVVQALYFFHPLVLLMNRRIRELREMACDDASIATGANSHIEYSKCLVEIAERVELSPFAYESVSTLIKRKRELLSRVKYQMKGGPMRALSKKRVIVVIALIVLLVVPLSWYKGGVTARQPAVGPVGSPAPIPGTDLKSVTLALHGDKKIKVGEAEVALEDLVALLDEELTGDRSKLVVKLECDKTVPMRTIYDVQELLTSMDLRKVQFRGQGYEDMALVLPPANVDEWLDDVSEEDLLSIVVDEEGHALINGERVPHAKLQGAIEDHLSMNPHVVFTLESSAKTKYGDFLEALEKLKLAGAPRIVIRPPGG